MLRPAGLQQYIALQREYQALQHDPDTETLDEFLDREKTIRDEMLATGVTVTDELRLVIFLMSSMPNKYATTIQLWDTMRIEDLTADKAISMLRHEDLRQRQENNLNPGDKPAKNKALKANSGHSKKQGKSQSKEKKARNPDKQGLHCGFCDIRDSHKEEDCWKKFPEKHPKKKQKNEENSTENKAYSSVTSMTSKAHSFGITGTQDSWIIDSGASQHLTGVFDALYEYKAYKTVSSTEGISGQIDILGEGKRDLFCIGTDQKIRKITLSKVQYAPKATVNLLSIHQLQLMQVEFRFPMGIGRVIGLDLSDPHSPIGVFQGTMVAGAYRLHLDGVSIREQSFLSIRDQVILWHSRTGHLNYQDLSTLYQSADGVPKLRFLRNLPVCAPCTTGKMYREKSCKPMPLAKEKLGKVHADLCIMPTTSFGGATCFACITDDSTRYKWVLFLKSKGHFAFKFKGVANKIEKQSGHKIQCILTDGGGELTSQSFEGWLEQEGVSHEVTPAHSSEMNPIAERANRTLVETARTMLHEADLPKGWWAEAISTAVYLRNRFPTARLKNLSPYEAWTDHKPNLKHLRVFGCKAWVHVPKATRKKLDNKAIQGIFMGYGCTTSLYRILVGNRVAEYRDVRFDETHAEDLLSGLKLEEQESINLPYPQPESDTKGDSNDQFEIDHQIGREIEAVDEQPPHELGGDSSDDNSESHAPVIHRSTRINRGKRALRYDEEYGSGSHHVSMMAINDSIPNSYQNAIRSPQHLDWKAAMDREMGSILENKTWKVIPNTGQKTVKCRWVFTRKDDGRFKARLVAKGYSQMHGIDYTETFAPTVKWNTIRLLFALAAFYDLELFQMDAITAFLNGDLDEIIYMDLPEGHEQVGMICQLLRSLYGLKQAPRQWYQKLENCLKSIGFRRSAADPCLYIRGTEPENSVYIAIYVDDLAIVGSFEHTAKLRDYLAAEFKMKDIGKIKTFLGVLVERNRAQRTISLSNKAYLEKILSKHGMVDCNSVSTPQQPGLHLKPLEKDDSGSYIGIEDHDEYRSLVGSLLYASSPCRPDLAYAAGALARFMHAPGSEHWSAAKHCLRYIQRTKDYQLIFGPNKDSTTTDLRIVVYTDSDFGGDKPTRKSTTGCVSMLYGGAVTWQSQLQKTVALSTMEAEYVALASATQEALWLSKLMLDITGDDQLPIPIKCDNTAALILAKNPENHDRAKHIDTKYHMVRDEIENKRIALEYVESRRNIGDILTKPLTIQLHQYLTSMLGLKK